MKRITVLFENDNDADEFVAAVKAEYEGRDGLGIAWNVEEPNVQEAWGGPVGEMNVEKVDYVRRRRVHAEPALRDFGDGS